MKLRFANNIFCLCLLFHSFAWMGLLPSLQNQSFCFCKLSEVWSTVIGVLLVDGGWLDD